MAELSDEDKAKRGALKDLIKEAVAELADERKEKGRTGSGDDEAKKKTGSIFDFFGS